ncbi:MAG: beta-N-acetylhexosaminidase [Verrucomicrobia bacterium]|nr:beta-N-acetylhexosaminidase [Verrucomicrobiota bacterium]
MTTTRTARAIWLTAMLPISGADVPPRMNLLPQPAKVEVREGSFKLTAETSVTAPIELENESRNLSAAIKAATGFEIRVSAETKPGSIRMTLDPKLSNIGPEGYRMEVRADGIEIAAPTAEGVFRGQTTLLDLLSPASDAGALIPCVRIEDQPRFRWRGLMLDCSRTFQSVEYLRATIDRMAAFKMNVLHLHLTDDQGWRIEIRKHPELTKTGAYFSPEFNEPPGRQGFYTQDQMRGIVAYAAARHISVVPEIEMPGHSHEVIVCKPSLSCAGKESGGIFPFFKGPNITEDIYCAGNEDVFRFLEETLDEVIEIFPSAFVHIGGDETPKTAWKSCPKCQARMKLEGIKTEHELQAYFIRRIEKYLAAKGRRLIGWDEILEGGLAPNATVMSWRGTAGGLAAADAGHNVVMSPTSHCYFDYTYGQIDSRKVFSFDPVAGMKPEAASRVLGLQANFWSHIDRDPALVDRQLFPRLMALAERGWSPDNRDAWQDYSRRARAHLTRLEKSGIHYQKSDLPAGP